MNTGETAGAPVSIHASAVVIGEAGIMIRGASGAGKSSLALALIALADQTAQFAALIGDDRLQLTVRNDRLIARGHPQLAGKIERRGQGILTLDAESAAVVRLVVDLLPPVQAVRFPETLNPYVTLCGIGLPSLNLLSSASAYDNALVVVARLRQFVAI